jgi:pyrimidine operon attenuation protein/uracil phosphoribosyltransferase
MKSKISNPQYTFNPKMRELLEKLLVLLKNEKKFVLCGIYTGGVIIGKELIKMLEEKGIKSNLYFVRLDKSDSYKVAETDLPKKLDKGTNIIFLDDAIWTGRTKFAVDKYLKNHLKGTPYKFATFLDCAGYADYSVF